ncbi:MAG: hypothetical protein COV52_01300 [Gammaproteobacteria bacterium CG11_big_fil_rev_8_21_14_0_20_46_22]|nr:MAG: hypothetical protein COW05_02480 [Gammaproteobacteria bacterium CG12_big_fil_rev_8_21_14_0_65_46_12]PIR11964.1 MAG: hypothetical protein COV52_01300 [Gammaproteobacteria bacterium CG11_big_fil_rev_8_21_14_0_20_46_22]
MTKPSPAIGIFLLAFMVPAGIFGLSAVVMPADFGLASVFFYFLGAILFFIPACYVAARFGMRWPGREGGVYCWISETFGPRWGLWAVWVQWIQQVIWYPTILSYMASTFAFVFFPHDVNSQLFIALFCVIFFVLLTGVAMCGIELSSRVIALAFIIGVLLPGLLFIVLVIVWQCSNQPTLLHFSWSGFLPSRHDWHNIALFNGVLTGFTGVELCAAYAHRVKRPAFTYTWAIVIATFITLTVFILGTLAVVAVLPADKTSFTFAIIHAIDVTLSHFHLGWLSKWVGLLIVVGSFAIVLVWILGPMLSFYSSAKHHQLPKWFSKTSKKGIPINLLILQGVVVSAFSLVFYFSSTVNDAFWLLSALSAQVYFLLYFVLFLAALKLQRSLFLWVCVVLGAIGCLFTVIVPFAPPKELLGDMSIVHYELFIGLGLVLCCAFPWVWSLIYKPHGGTAQ